MNMWLICLSLTAVVGLLLYTLGRAVVATWEGAFFSDQEDCALARWEEQIMVMRIVEARARFERLLGDGGCYLSQPVMVNRSGDEVFDEFYSMLPGVTRRFFEQYGTVTNGTTVGVGPGYFHRTNVQEMIEIGGSEDGGAFVFLSDDVIYSRLWDAPPESVAPTIYHWLLLNEEDFDASSEGL